MVVFGVFYVFTSIGTIFAIELLVNSKFKKLLQKIVIGLTSIILVSLILIYIWPGNIRTAENYFLFYLLNGILSVDLFFRIPLSFFYLLSMFFYRNKNRQKIISLIGFIISVCFGFTILYGITFGKTDLQINRVELRYKNLPAGFNNYQIVHISDVHLGSFNNSQKLLKKVQRKIEEINPDLILFTGDLVNNYASELNGWKPVFDAINKGRNSFSVLGNHDYGNYSDWQNQIKKRENLLAITNAHREFGFRLLRNENILVKNANDSIYIVGVENWGHPPFPQYANLQKALAGVPQNAFKILLTHDPAHWEAQVVGKEQIELTLSGHTHGFQIGILKAGIPFSFALLSRKNWGGLYNYNDIYLYVNTGLGMVGLPWRINMPPEITIITLKRIEID
jgi:predicted MPP superfamily phosphohydrolase